MKDSLLLLLFFFFGGFAHMVLAFSYLHRQAGFILGLLLGWRL